MSESTLGQISMFSTYLICRLRHQISFAVFFLKTCYILEAREIASL